MYPPRVRARATVKLSVVFFHDESSITKGGYESAIAPKNIHQKNRVIIAIEIYKFQADLTPPIMSDLIVTRENNYNLRNFQELENLHSDEQ